MLTQKYNEINNLVEKLITQDLSPVMQQSVVEAIEKRLEELEEEYLQVECEAKYYAEHYWEALETNNELIDEIERLNGWEYDTRRTQKII